MKTPPTTTTSNDTHTLLTHVERILQKLTIAEQKIDALTTQNKQLQTVVNQHAVLSAQQVECYQDLKEMIQYIDIKDLDFHHWAISPDLGKYLVTLAKNKNFDNIIEMGSGTSTVLLAAVVSRSCFHAQYEKRILTFEHDTVYKEKTKSKLADNLLSDYVIMADTELDDSGYYSDCEEQIVKHIGDDTGKSFLVFVDGPPGQTSDHSRMKIKDIVMSMFPNAASIDVVIDDFNRSDENEMVYAWLHELDESNIKYEFKDVPSEKGLAHINITPMG